MSHQQNGTAPERQWMEEWTNPDMVTKSTSGGATQSQAKRRALLRMTVQTHGCQTDKSGQVAEYGYACEPRSRSQQAMGRFPGLVLERVGSRPGIAAVTSGDDDLSPSDSTSPEFPGRTILLEDSEWGVLIQMVQQPVQSYATKEQSGGS